MDQALAAPVLPALLLLLLRRAALYVRLSKMLSTVAQRWQLYGILLCVFQSLLSCLSG